MIVPPGFNLPSLSAASIIVKAIRSLIEPVGFWFSSFTKSWQRPVSIRVISTSGVLPINERIAGALSGKVDLAGVALVIEDWRIDRRRAGDHSYATRRFRIVKGATTCPGYLIKSNPLRGGMTTLRAWSRRAISARP